MIPAIFINCRRHPFIDWIIDDLKLDETRTRNTLKALAGHRVILAETGTGSAPVARCTAVIHPPVVVRSREEWERLRPRHRVPRGSAYDWQETTTVKYLYPITGVVACHPFKLTEGLRHGRVWMEVTA